MSINQITINSFKKYNQTTNIYFVMDNYNGRVTGSTKFGNVVGKYPGARFVVRLDTSTESNDFLTKIDGLATRMLKAVMDEKIITNQYNKPMIDTTFIEMGNQSKLVMFKMYMMRDLGKMLPAGDKTGPIKFNTGRSEITVYKETVSQSNTFDSMTVPIYTLADLHKYPGLYNIKYRITGLSVNEAGPEIKYSLILMAVELIKIEFALATDLPTINGRIININSPDKQVTKLSVTNGVATNDADDDDEININDEEVKRLLNNLNAPKPVSNGAIDTNKKPIINGFSL